MTRSIRLILGFALLAVGLNVSANDTAPTATAEEAKSFEQAWEENPTEALKDQAAAQRAQLMSSLTEDDSEQEEIKVDMQLERDALKADLTLDAIEIDMDPAITMPKPVSN